jgi:hypothetical protein
LDLDIHFVGLPGEKDWYLDCTVKKGMDEAKKEKKEEEERRRREEEE